MTPFHAHFKVKVALHTGTSTVHLSSTSHNPDSEHPYDFYVAAWMGHNNQAMDFKILEGQADGTGVAQLRLPIEQGDPSTFKLGVYLKDPKTRMMLHLASGCEKVGWLCDAMAPDFASARQAMTVEDNYSKNKALVHFANAGTDLGALRQLPLQPSVLLKNEEINKTVMEMTKGVSNLIQSAASVSNLNGGPNFLASLCFTEATGCAINYPLLNMTYSSKRHLAPLSLLSYMSLATLHATGMSAEEVQGLSDHEFVHRFVVPLCTSFTVCPATMIYAGDKTLGVKGRLDQPTEDFAMVMCDHYYTDVTDSYVDRHKGTLAEMSNTQLLEHIQTLGAEANSRGHFLIADDCETLTGLSKAIEGGIHHEGWVLVGGDGARLGKAMWDATRPLKNLSSVPLEDFMSCGRLLCRYAALRENCYKCATPSAQMGLAVVSAKGASFSTSNCDLNGHACAVAQVLDASGQARYFIAEGTTNVTAADLPPACPKKVTLVLAEGVKTFDTREALNIIAQNMSEMLATKGKSRIAQTIPLTFDGKDPYTSCPFYMAGFFVGFEMGATIPGVIPLDTMHSGAGRPVLAGGMDAPAHPLFGAPVAGLSMDCVQALPVNLGYVMGEQPARDFLAAVDMRNREAYPPRASDHKLTCLASRWGDLEPLPKKASTPNTWVLSCAEAFECADTVRAMGEYKRRLARDFNALQDKDPMSDGIKMSVRLHMLSAVCHFTVPLPAREKWGLSCARNMRLALKALPVPARPEIQVGVQFALL